MAMHISHHFADNWGKRVGGTPSSEQIQGIIDNSIRIQKGQYFQLSNGESFNTLTLYWHPELDLVIMYDAINRTLVSVLSKANWMKPNMKQKPRRPEVVPGYVPLSMHC